MQRGNVTTPFGRRPMTLALVRRQVATAEADKDRPVDKWKVFRDACEARALLGVQDRALAVLDALLTFHPVQELSRDRAMVVFPSNAQLSVRAHGIAGTTLRRHLAALVEAGLIIRRDSPNGKRYARKDRAGDIESAFGFDLSPLHARAEELAMLAQQVADERARFRRVKEELSICRRDVRKLVSAAMEEGADGDWAAIEDIYIGLCARVPRSPTIEQIVELGAGSIIKFEKSCDEMLELEIGGSTIARGEAVKVGDKFGLRIHSMVLPGERFQKVERKLG